MTECAYCQNELEITLKPTDRPVLSVCSRCMNPLAVRHSGGEWHAEAPNGVQDIRQLAVEGSIGARLVSLLPAAIDNLPIPPEIARRTMALIRDPEFSMGRLTELLSQDQVIALKILKLANSPVYRGLTEVKDLDTACARLGVRAIANAIQTIANGPVYSTKSGPYREMMVNLWRHALASAYCASQIAVMLAEPRSDTFFVAGLVHDVGKVLLLNLVGNKHIEAMRVLRDSDRLLMEFLEGFGAFAGLHVVSRWNLPSEFAISTFCHGRSEAVPDDSWLPYVHTVTLASAIADSSGFGIAAKEVSLLSLPSTKYLGLTDVRLAELRLDVEDKIQPLLEITTDSESSSD